MRTRRLLSLLVAFAALLTLALGTAGPSAAAPCPYVGACAPSIAVQNGVIAVGSTQVFVAAGFLPGEQVTITVAGPAGTFVTIPVTADAQGTATGSFLVTADMIGQVTVAATGLTSTSRVSTQFTVVAAVPTGGGSGTTGGGTGGYSGAAGSSGGLAFTGVAAGATLVLAVGLLVTGLALVVAGRRRSRA